MSSTFEICDPGFGGGMNGLYGRGYTFGVNDIKVKGVTRFKGETKGGWAWSVFKTFFEKIIR